MAELDAHTPLRITVVTCVKNEGPFLLEWIAFNRVIGVTDFLFYSNDCSDATDELLEALVDRDIVHHLPNPAKGRNYQMEAFRDARKQDVVTEADWVLIIDVDEFLNIHVGDGTLSALIEACGDPQAISFLHQFFANGGVDTYHDIPVIEQFTHSHNPDIWLSDTEIEVKTMIRRDFPVQYYGVHRPYFKASLPKERYPSWTDGSGRAVPRQFSASFKRPRVLKLAARGARNYATLNHYALRSLDSYLVKSDRGDVNRDHRFFDDTYWRERNDPAWEDRSILRLLPRLKDEVENLKKYPEIKQLHDKSVALHQAKRDQLLELPHFQELQKKLRAASEVPPKEEELIAAFGLDFEG